MPKIALCMIAKTSEWQELDNCLASVKDQVDSIFVLFNAKKGADIDHGYLKTVDKYGIDSELAEWTGNFGEMRNKSLARIPKEYDWVLWLDVDDTLELVEGVTLQSIVTNTPKNFSGIMARYNYDYNAQGKLIEVLKLIRLFKNDGSITWRDDVIIHETLVDNRNVAKCYSDEFWIEHHTDSERREESLKRNIELLEKQLEGEKNSIDPRTLFYLGISHADSGNYDRAFDLLETYLLVSGWDEERAEANNWLGRICMNRNQPGQAKKYYSQALSETPYSIDGYIGLGSAEHALRQYDKAIMWLELALVIKPKSTSITQTPFDNKYRPYMLLSQCHLELGGPHIETALGWANKAYAFAEDEISLRQIKLLEHIMKERDDMQAFITKAKKLLPRKAEIERLFSKLPQDIKTSPAVLGFMNQIRDSKKWTKKSIVIYCGSGPLKGWTPESLKTGIGGSEEAVIRISKHLRDLGYKVTVYAEPLAKDGNYDGVEYRNYWEISFKDKFDTFISWRSPWVFDYPIKANKKYLWLHDVMETSEFTPERLANLDKVMVLTKYHRNLFPNIPDDKIFMTGNGIDPEDFEKVDGTIGRDPHRIIYTSSHVRGLEHLYYIWPKVKKAVPDARLDAYYGWDSYDNVNAGNPERMAWKEKMVHLANSLPDVYDNGRIGQDKIVEETFRSGVWAYPCPFPEVYCIAAVKAQAAGAFPVCSSFAALDEVVQWGEKTNMQDFDEKVLDEYADKLISILLDTERQNKERKLMQDWARTNMSWRLTAEGWDHEIQSK
jgi:tetratricopeptide (TPR) repeat protein